MIFGRKTVEVPCTVEIEQTPEFLQAHAIPEGIDIRPGDTVLVHGAPTDIQFGERVSLQCRATVIRASWPERVWTQVKALFELTELYEVGFQRGR
jgi:hypothetical protein